MFGKVAKIYFYLFLFFVALILFVGLIMNNLDNDENSYKNKQEIIKDKAIDRGWIPAIIPDSAYQIEEKHNLDSNKLNGSFLYKEKDEKSFINKLQNKDGIFSYEHFIFEVDKDNNKVKFKNK